MCEVAFVVRDPMRPRSRTRRDTVQESPGCGP